MELKDGMYVRTEYGIFKIRKITKDLGYSARDKRVLELDRNIPELDYNYKFYKDESIFKNAKFSSNLIDLIKVGDYVNGLKVDKKYEDRVVINTRDDIIVWFEYQIKSIVTKEQFDSMKYEVGE